MYFGGMNDGSSGQKLKQKLSQKWTSEIFTGVWQLAPGLLHFSVRLSFLLIFSLCVNVSPIFSHFYLSPYTIYLNAEEDCCPLLHYCGHATRHSIIILISNEALVRYLNCMYQELMPCKGIYPYTIQYKTGKLFNNCTMAPCSPVAFRCGSVANIKKSHHVNVHFFVFNCMPN